MSEETKPEWSIEETIAKAMCHRSVGDVHAVDINGRQRWNWYVEDANKFISTYGHKLQHFGAVWDGVSWSIPNPLNPSFGDSGWEKITSAPTSGEFIARVSPEFPGFSCFWDGSAFVHYDKDEGLIHYNPTEWKPMPSALSTPTSQP